MPSANASVQSLSHCDIQTLALRAAKAAGAVLLECRQKALVVDRLFAHDVKLEADRLSEDAILRVIREAMPDAFVMTEESGELPGTSEYVWIIDPLDGTMNYYHGQHHFCTCVACYRRMDSCPVVGLARLGTPVAGVVYAPAYDELFSCQPTGGSASCNDHPVCVSGVRELADAIVTTSFASKPEVMARMEGVVHELVRRTRKVRIQGSCGLDICGVAAGRLSALYQSDVRCWDFAAARVILEEAGGKLEALEVAPNRWNVLACAPGIFTEMQALVNNQ